MFKYTTKTMEKSKCVDSTSKRKEYREVEIKQSKDLQFIRNSIVTSTEKCVLSIIQQLASGKSPKVKLGENDESSVEEEEEEEETEQDDEEEKEDKDYDVLTSSSQKSADTPTVKMNRNKITKKATTLNFNDRQGRKKLALMLEVSQRVYSRIVNEENSFQTRRSLYYEFKDNQQTKSLVKKQVTVDNSIRDLAVLLGCSERDMGFVASSKGLAAGKVSFIFEDGKITDFNVERDGVLISHNIEDATIIKHKVKRVIVVEKDSIFQKLLQENCPQILKCILVTGKGYPDVATRRFVRILSEKLELPVYALVDANPYGVDIMCAYRYGTLTQLRQRNELTCPNLIWIGVFPSELKGLKLKSLRSELSKSDLSKLMWLKNRSYLSDCIKEELEEMKNGKLEIEAIAGYSQNFLTSCYLPYKIKHDYYRR